MGTDKQFKINAFRAGLAQFITFEESEWEILSEYLSFSTLKKKDHFVVEGKVCDYIGFIIQGAVRHYYVKDGQEITGYFCFENELVSAYKSFLKRIPSTNFIQALEETELVLIAFSDLQKMLNHPLLALKWKDLVAWLLNITSAVMKTALPPLLPKAPKSVIPRSKKLQKIFFSVFHSTLLPTF